MSDSPQQRPSTLKDSPSTDRLESWKEIAAYLRRDVKTVQRWEKREGMPVHRHLHDKLGSVFAFRAELDDWARNRRSPASDDAAPPPFDTTNGIGVSVHTHDRRVILSTRTLALGAAALVILLVAGSLFMIRRGTAVDENPIAKARFVQLTDFNGLDQAAAISRDGKLAAFLSDRDGQMDVWLTQIGSSGEAFNLTRGSMRALVNPSVRQLDFSPDGTLVTFWANQGNANENSRIGIWAVPVVGGAPRVYLDGAAEYQWSVDGGRLVYHTPGPGDPMFVRDGQNAPARQVFVARPGLHGHFPTWSPDASFIYFVQGTPGDRMDVWRLKPGAAAPERITNHNAAVSYPVFVDSRHLLYLATDRDGSGPWIFCVDPETGVSRRVSAGIDRFTSLAATADGRRLVATLATPKSTLWRVPLDGSPVTDRDAHAIALTTGNGSSPRFGGSFLLYVSSTGASDTIWRLEGDRPTQVWTSREGRVIGGPTLSPDQRRVAFSTRAADGRTHLWIVDADGTGARALSVPFEVEGSAAWTPDGRGLTVGALVDGVPHLFTVPIDGGAPIRMLQDASTDPVWSADGGLLVFSGADVGTTFRVSAVDAQARPHPIPELTLMRGGRHIAFIGQGRTLVFLRGDFTHRDVWAVDLQTGAERQLTNFGPGFDVRDFDITPDGRQLVVERVQEHSNIVLLELPR